MAKRKRKSVGGGAFGRAGARSLAVAHTDDDEPEEIVRNRAAAEAERFSATLCRQVQRVIGGPLEESQAFGRMVMELSREEFLERFDPEPEAHFLAIARLEDRTDDDSEETIRDRVAEAFALDADCVDAHLALIEVAGDAPEIMGHYRDAVEAGRRKHEKRLTAEPDPAGHVLDLPYREALFELADYLRVQGSYDEAEALYHEILDLDPDDQLDVHSPLIAMAACREDLDALRALLDGAPLQQSCSVLYGRAFLALSEALAESPDFQPDTDSDRPFAALNTPKAREARRLFKAAWEFCPWGVAFVTEPRTIMKQPISMYSVGDPFDALEFARLNCLNWTGVGVVSLWAIAESVQVGLTSETMRRLSRYHGEFLEAIEVIDGLTLPVSEEDDELATLEQFSGVSEQIIETMISAGESRKGWRFRR